MARWRGGAAVQRQAVEDAVQCILIERRREGGALGTIEDNTNGYSSARSAINEKEQDP